MMRGRFSALAGLLVLAFAAAPLDARFTTQGTGAPPAQGGGRGGGRGQQGNGQATRDTSATAQQPTGTGTLSGRVTSNDGRPVRRARVTLSGGELRFAQSASTDDQGRFGFTAVPAGRFSISASKAGYVNATYGQKKPGRPGTPIQLADGQAISDLAVTLPRGGVITGTIFDENGEPSTGTQVTVWRAEMRTGEKRLVQTGNDQTDDRGIYRIYGLMPGEYLVRATPRTGALRAAVEEVMAQALEAGRGGRGGAMGGGALQQLVGGRGGALALFGNGTDDDGGVGYAPVYYPGTTTSTGAATVTLDVSQERTGIDFPLQLVRTATVTGMVSSPTGDTSGVLLLLVNETERAIGGGLNTARVQQDGTFTFSNVAPGQYEIQARQGGRGGRGGRGGGRGGQTATPDASASSDPAPMWGATAISVNGQPVANVLVALREGMTVSGRLAFEGGAPPADLTRVRVALTPVVSSQGLEIAQAAPAQLDASGAFRITGVPPGQYSVRVQGQVSGYSLKSAEAGGRDVLDFPLDVRPNDDVAGLIVTMSTETQELSGTLTDGRGLPATDYTVIVFADEPRYWLPQSRRIASARPGTDGRFVVRGLPAGRYLMAAVTDVEPGEWYDPDLLQQLRAASVAVTLSPNEKRVQDLRLSGGGA
jgi:protocatechuate 3,4-dioxygenase beta subunit